MRKTFRTLRKLVSLASTIAFGIGEFWFATRRDVPSRARWMQRMSRRFLRILNCRVTVEGEVPDSGIVVCNHLGYVDVLALGSVRPMLFVAKSDVRGWPIFGLLCRLAGTVFVDRDRRTSVGESLGQIEGALQHGLPVVLFPEGTSSGGESVLPFRSSLLGIASGQSLTPVAVDYAIDEGNISETVCYWRDMVFAGHLWRLLGEREIRARLVFGVAMPSTGDRKRDAVLLRERVIELRGDQGKIPCAS